MHSAITVQNVLNNFDFARVQQVMLFMGWRWQVGNALRVPTVPELEATARMMLELLSDEQSSVTSGGLVADIDDGALRLRFVIEQRTSEVK
ncbi:MAG: hypothetical protein KA362_00305 [Chloroflexi bacterium]|nr:hypothetical protein [Chloroflexota bacterium]